MINKPVILVTGGTRGIGYAIAKEFINQDNIVICCSRKGKDDLNKVFLDFLNNHSNLDYMKCDTTNELDVNKLFDYINVKYNKIDVLVNNVGSSTKSPLLSAKVDLLREMLDINLLSTIYCTKYAIRLMLMKKRGKVINISSIAGTNGLAFESAYSAAKAGIIGFGKSVAKEYGTKGISCNTVVPGIIETEKANTSVTTDTLNKIALKRVGKPQDIADLVCFLASEKASYITGETIKIDGGLFI